MDIDEWGFKRGLMDIDEFGLPVPTRAWWDGPGRLND